MDRAPQPPISPETTRGYTEYSVPPQTTQYTEYSVPPRTTRGHTEYNASPDTTQGYTEYSVSPRAQQGYAEDVIPCPKGCGTVLTGIHALGNLTRHLKSEACTESTREKVKFPCLVTGCGKEYARSDGLKVHMRRRHGAPPPTARDPEYGQ
ncbi:hypothetical protein BKA66DRAFT_175306 [Pyrenochaeta sp. MPI-SDFR-AT-0127]|nr:hypothetical protein BKA66DRAFT_175306 [Pyrenochaeta sp. MPI-SDFR-AT-0127]